MILYIDSGKNFVYLGFLFSVGGGREVSVDSQEAVREPLGMAFRKPDFGKRKYFILLLI